MDAFLGIHTCGRLAYQEDRLHYPYEPTPYVVLEALWKSGQVGPDNCLVDYGCGKGRVVFYGAGVMGCRAIGVERDRHLYGLALENLASFKEKESSGPLCPLTQGEGGKDPSQRISFFHGGAEEYLPPPGADRFFFFNPFSQVILARVLDKLLDSYYACPRDMRILYYYGDKELSCYLASRRDLSLKEELDVSAYFSKGKDREKILVFHIG